MARIAKFRSIGGHFAIHLPHMITVGLVLGLTAVTAGPAQANATIHPIFDSSITSLSNASTVEAAFNTVANDFAQSINNPVTINVGVSWGSVDGYTLPNNAVGASVDNLYGYFTYAQVKSYLVAAANSNPSDTALASAIKFLPASAPSGVSQYVIPSSEAKALGLIAGGQSSNDGYIGFAGSTSNYTFSPTKGIASGTYDFEAVAAHELDEVLGRISGLTSTSPSYRTPFDLFRYSAQGAISLAYNSSAYFSINGGQTDLGNFNNSSSGGDRADWLTLSNSTDIQDAFVSTGQRLNLTAGDLTGLDVIGWGGSNLGDTSSSTPGAVAFNLIDQPGDVPEIPTWSMMIAGFGLSGTALRLRPRCATA